MKFVLVIMMLLLPACSTQKFQSNTSYIGVTPKEKAISQAIINDLSLFIATLYAPGHTSFNFITPIDEKEIVINDEIMDSFSTLLENGLRKRGFEISKKGMGLSYTFDTLEENNFYTQIRFEDKTNFSSIYNKKGEIISRSSLKEDTYE